MSRFRPPSISQPNHFLTGTASAPADMDAPAGGAVDAAAAAAGVVYQGPPTPSFARRQSQILASQSASPPAAPSPTTASSPTTTLESPAAKAGPPKRAPPARPSQVAADGNAPPPSTVAPSPLQTDTMSMSELNAVLKAATSPSSGAAAPFTPTNTVVSGSTIRCDSDSTHVAKVHCPDCDEYFCLDCDSLVHGRKKFMHHLRSGIDPNAPRAVVKAPPPVSASGSAVILSPPAVGANGLTRRQSKLLGIGDTGFGPGAAGATPNAAATTAASPLAVNVASPSPASPEVVYKGPSTPSFARKQSMLANKGTTSLLSSPNTAASPSPSPSPIGTSPVTPAVATAPAADPNALAPGWIEYHDNSSGKQYYHNASTGATVWDRPVATVDVAAQQAAAAAAAAAQQAAQAAAAAAKLQAEQEAAAAAAKLKAEQEAASAAAAAAAAAQAEAAAIAAASAEAERKKEEERQRAAAAATLALQQQQDAAAAAAATEKVRLEAELEKARLVAAAEAEKLRMEAQLEIERNRALAAAEAEKVRAAAAAESERIRAEQEALRAETERLRAAAAVEAEKARVAAAEAEAERARAEKERAQAEKAALEARLEAMERKMEEDARVRAEQEAAAAAAKLKAEQEAAAAAAAAQAKVEEEARLKAEQEAAAAAAAAAAEAERLRAEEAARAAAAAAEEEAQRVKAEAEAAAAAAAAEHARKEAEEAAAKKEAAAVAAVAAAAPSAATPAPVEEEWIEYKDQSSGRSYYFNPKTNKTVWEKPTPAPAAAPAPAPAVPVAPVAPVISLAPKRGSVIIKNLSEQVTMVAVTPGAVKPPPPKRGSISSIAVGGLLPPAPQPSAHPHPPPSSSPAVSSAAPPVAPPAPSSNVQIAPKRGSVIIKSLPSAVAAASITNLIDDDEDLPKEPPPKPSAKDIALRRASIRASLNLGASALSSPPPPLPAAAYEAEKAKEKAKEEAEKKAKQQEEEQRKEEERKKQEEEKAQAAQKSAGGAQAPVLSNPDEWRAVQDPSTGQTYWYNRRSRETSWVDPATINSPSSDESANPKSKVNPNTPWKEYKDTDGRAYYHNTATDETSWEVPPDYLLPDANPLSPSSATSASGRGRPVSVTTDQGLDSDEDLGSDDDEDDDVAELAKLGSGGNVRSMTVVTNSPSSASTSVANGPRTLSDATALSPVSARAASVSVSLTSPSSRTGQKTKCVVAECFHFSVRDGFCLRHVWRKDVAHELKLKESIGQQVAAKEILTTEKSYLEQLRTIQKSFLLRMQTALTLYPSLNKPALMSEDDIHKVFLNIGELLAISEALYADLAELHFNDRLVEFVATTLLHYIPRFAVYSNYLEGFDESRKRIAKLKLDNPELASFVKVSEKIEGLSLDSFLVTPVQRLPRYLLLIKELVRRIPPCPSDVATTQILADLNLAHDELAKMTTSLNSSLSTAENLSQLKNLSRLFVRNDSRFQSFLKPNRKLLKLGILRKKFSSKSYNLQSYKSYYFFLTNDLIWYASALRESSEIEEAAQTGQSHVAMYAALNAATEDSVQPIYKMKHMYRLEDMLVGKSDPKATQKALKKGENPLKFYMWNNDGRTIVLAAATEAEREQWFQAIDSAIASAKQNAK